MSTATFSGQVQQVVVLTAAWATLFIILRFFIFKRLSATFSNVAVSCIHALTALSLCSLAIDWEHPLSGYGGSTTPAQLKMLTVSLAYFTYDSLACELIQHDVPNLLHHIATLAGLCVGVFQHYGGPELCVCLVLMELSSPCLHSRTMFKELKMKDSGIAFTNDLLFAMTFMLCRLAAGPVVTYYCLKSPTTSNIVKVGALGVQVVSLFWAWQIISVVAHKAKKRKALK